MLGIGGFSGCCGVLDVDKVELRVLAFGSIGGDFGSND